MQYELSEQIIKYLEDSYEETLQLLEELCKIPAPSNHEEKRAAFCKKWLEQNGAEGVYIDDALNVVYPLHCEGKKNIVVFMAHMDTVFPDMTEPMPYHRDEKRIYSPGVGDDTACLVMLLMVVKYIIREKLTPQCGMLFVANAGEEGLGNLKGVKQIMSDYKGRIDHLYTLDGRYNELVWKCVGSHRYRITVKTEGGHSFSDFGNLNAICVAAELIHNLNRCQLPQDEDSKTTYNVGVIEGGTSVNTIAQSASFLYEYRSDSHRCLEEMKAFFENEIRRMQNSCVAEISVDTIGVRPCGNNVDRAMLEKLTQRAVAICQKHSGERCVLDSGSTDANIPMSMGIPAICVGTYQGGGAHTREEYLDVDSIPVGLKIAAELILAYFN